MTDRAKAAPEAERKPPWVWGLEQGQCQRVVRRVHFGSRGERPKAGGEYTRSGPLHAAADIIHGWSRHDRETGEDCRITAEAYAAALAVANGPAPYAPANAARPGATR